MSNYCACSGGDEEYTIELNQQGPEGPQGPVGPEGFSPSISVKTSTDNAYILTVVNKEGTFDTPNLYGETEKLNADLSNIPNPAFINGVSLYSIEDNIPMITMDSSRITTNVDGNLILNATASNEETMEVFNYEVVVNPKEQRLELHDNEGTVKIVATTEDIPTINVATTTTAGIVKPDGNTITVSADGTISANLSNYVTSDELAVDLQDINSKIASKLDTATYETDKATYATKEELASTDATVASIQTELGNKLESSNIIAGANVTIDRNGNNLTISSTGGGGEGGAAIDDGSITTVSTWSSSKINSEITTAVDTINSTKNDNIFDISKFAVLGTPTINDNGVVSNPNTNFYEIRTINIGSLLNKSWSITNLWINNGITKRPSDATKVVDEGIIVIGGTPAYGIVENYGGESIRFTGRFGDLDNNTGTTQITVISKTWAGLGYTTTPNKFLVKLEFNYEIGEYKLHIKVAEEKDWKLVGTYIPTTPNKQLWNIFNNPNYFISASNKSVYNVIYNTIDLKHFSITIDGEVVFNGLMESTKPIYDKITSTSTALTTFQTETDNNFSAVNSALNEKANLSDLSGYVTVTKYNELLARVVALETEINGGNA